MAAMRLARTVTGRDLVGAFFRRVSRHDRRSLVKVDARRAFDSRRRPAFRARACITCWYSSTARPRALEMIRRRTSEIAAVLVEPVQSRHPGLRPVEFLASCADHRRVGAALVFDEVVTGFRTHPGGAQALFGIRADMATYGKVVAGGMPIGVFRQPRLHGCARRRNWRFGDDSIPPGRRHFFCRYLRAPSAHYGRCPRRSQTSQEAGPSLQGSLNKKPPRSPRTLHALRRVLAFPRRSRPLLHGFSSRH